MTQRTAPVVTGVVALSLAAVSPAAAQALFTDVNATGISETAIAQTDGTFDNVFFTGGFTADGASAGGGTDSGHVNAAADASSVTTLDATVTSARGGVSRVDFLISARSEIIVLDPSLLAFAETSASIGGSDTFLSLVISEATGYRWETELITPGAVGGEVSLSLLDLPDEGVFTDGQLVRIGFSFGISARTDINRLFNEAVLRGTLFLPGPGVAGVLAAGGLFAARRRRA
jgi:hypothetical protein